MSTNRKNLLLKAASVCTALLVWQLVSCLVGADYLLAPPPAVLKSLILLLPAAEFRATVFFSLSRILLGFAAALICSCLFAVLAGRFRTAEILLQPYVTAVKTVPVACFIILCLLWVSYRRLTVIIAFLIAFPVLYANILQGIKSADAKLTEMATLYRVPWKRRLLYIYVPAVKPYLLSSCRTAVGMAWKAGVAAEIIGIVDGSIGERLYEAKITFQNAELLAWTVTVILLSIAMEKLTAVLLRLLYKGVEKL